MSKRQRWVVGAVVKIPLEDGTHCYGALMELPMLVVFDYNSEDDLEVGQIAKLDILFKLDIMRYAVSRGHFEKIGRFEPTDEMLAVPKAWKQDPLTYKFYIVDPANDDYDGYEVEFRDCMGFEQLSVWDPDHLQERIFDYYNGRPNRHAPTIWRPDGSITQIDTMDRRSID